MGPFMVSIADCSSVKTLHCGQFQMANVRSPNAEPGEDDAGGVKRLAGWCEPTGAHHCLPGKDMDGTEEPLLP